MPHAPLDLLCIEPRFPGRLGGVADWLVRRRGYRVRFYCHRADPPETLARGDGSGDRGRRLRGRRRWPRSRGRLDEGPRARALLRLRLLGGPRRPTAPAGRPDPRPIRRPRLVPVRPGQLPARRRSSSSSTPTTTRRRREPGDEAEAQPEAFRHWRRAANAVELVELENGVTPWTPTDYQRGLFPAEYRDDFLVLHDGVETRGLPPRNRGRLVLGDRTIPEGARRRDVRRPVARPRPRLRPLRRPRRVGSSASSPTSSRSPRRPGRRPTRSTTPTSAATTRPGSSTTTPRHRPRSPLAPRPARPQADLRRAPGAERPPRRREPAAPGVAVDGRGDGRGVRRRWRIDTEAAREFVADGRTGSAS